MTTQSQPTAAHTPTPWSLIASDPGFSTARVYSHQGIGGYETIARDVADSNAAFIVRACNEYADDKAKIKALVEALTELEGVIIRAQTGHLVNIGSPAVDKLMTQARAALESAKQ